MAATLKVWRATLHLATAISLLLAVSCGVRIQIATTPTAVPTTRPTLGDSMLTRSVAAPRISFINTSTAQAQPFMQGAVANVLLVKASLLRLTLDYDATWYGVTQNGAQGSGLVRLSVFTRQNPAESWLPYDSVEQQLTASSSPSTVHDTLEVNVSSSTPGTLYIRAEVEVVARPLQGDVTNLLSAVELSAIVFSSPDELPQGADVLTPPFGTLDAAHALLDWRAWGGGPCTLVEKVTAEAVRISIQRACAAFNAKNLQRMTQALQNALDQSPTPEIAAALHDQFGLVASTLNELPTALEQFDQAAAAWQGLARAGAYAISAANSAALRVQQALADPDKADKEAIALALNHIMELHNQYNDDAGSTLLEANLGHLMGDQSALNDANSFFEAHQLPQAAVSTIWLQALEATPTP